MASNASDQPEPQSVLNPQRSVSFHLDEADKPAVTSAPAAPTASTESAATTGSAASSGRPLRSALKPRAKDYRKLPDAEQYQHPDPLLRRLRLVDAQGKPVNLRKHFDPDVKCVGFYFSSEWAGQPLKEYHQRISDFCRQHSHGFKVVYASVDVDEEWYKAGIRNKPWVSMVWNDGSSEEPGESDDGADSVEKTALYNGEDFLYGDETDIDESLSQTDTSGQAYLRPYSRVHLASKYGVIAAPTLMIYHIPSQKMIERNVRMSRLEPSSDAWEHWRKGEKVSGIDIKDIFYHSPGTFIITFALIIYFVVIQVLGEEYNVLPRLISGAASNLGMSSDL